MTDQTTLDSPFVKQGVEHVSFWNGRVLTGEDLRDEQEANASSRRRLGRAVGAGIASGLMVSRAALSTQVLVSAGVAVNLEGQALELPVDVAVSLVVPADPGAPGDGVFTVCPDVPSEVPPTTGTGSGVYLLVMCPASASKEEAAGVPFNGGGVASVCGPRYSVDGVSFRLVGVDASGLAGAAGHDAADLATLASLESATPDDDARNVLSHLFLNTVARRNLVLGPFGAAAAAAYGTIDSLRDDGSLDDCEVPLGLILWTGGAVGYAESWAVRRPRSSAYAAASALEALGSGRPVAEGAAAYFQFQHHLNGLASALTAAQRQSLRAMDRFRYLPAAGVVRLGASGFVESQFLSGITTQAAVSISHAQVVPLLEASFGYPPIDLTTGEVLYRYHVRGAVTTGAAEAADPPPAYVIFTSSQIPYLGDELAIDAVFPPGILQLSDQIEIRGRGFGFSTGAARITFATTGGSPVNANALAGSSDTKLIVVVPPTLQVSEDGDPVTIRVTNGEEEDSVPVVVQQQSVVLDGDIDVTFISVDPDPIEEGQPATFLYTIGSRLNRAADVTVTARETSAAASFPQDVEVRDASGAELPNGIVHLERDESTAVFVFVDSIEDVPSMTLTVRAEAGGVVGESIDPFTVGEEAPQADPDIGIRINDITLQPGSTGSISGSTITLAQGSAANVELFVDISAAGTFDVTLEPLPPGPGWAAAVSNPGDGTLGPISDGDLDTAGGTQIEAVLFAVGPDSSGAAGSSSVALVVQRQGATLDSRRVFNLEVQP